MRAAKAYLNRNNSANTTPASSQIQPHPPATPPPPLAFTTAQSTTSKVATVPSTPQPTSSEVAAPSPNADSLLIDPAAWMQAKLMQGVSS